MAKYGAFANKMNSHAESAAASTTNNVIVSIPIDLIDENPDNGKIFSMDNIDSIADRMKAKGDTAPIRVRKKEDGRYEVLEGHRRLRAHVQNGDKKIDCMVGNEKSEAEIADALVMSNLTTRDLSPMEEARAMQYWIAKTLPELREKDGVTGKTSEIISKKLNISSRSVARKLSLLKLIPELQDMILAGKIEYTTVLPLTQMEEEKQRDILTGIKAIVNAGEKDLSLEDVEKLIEGKDGKQKKKTPGEKRIKSTISKSEKAMVDLVTSFRKNPFSESSVKTVAENIKDGDIENIKKIRDYLDEIIKAKS